MVIDLVGMVPEMVTLLRAKLIHSTKRPPISLSLNRSSNNPTSAASVDYALIFSEAVTGVDVSDFELIASGVTWRQRHQHQWERKYVQQFPWRLGRVKAHCNWVCSTTIPFAMLPTIRWGELD